MTKLRKNKFSYTVWNRIGLNGYEINWFQLNETKESLTLFLMIRDLKKEQILDHVLNILEFESYLLNLITNLD